MRAGEDLQAALDAAPDGTAVCLAPGAYVGPLRVSRSVTLWGPRGAVVRSAGGGTTVTLSGAGALLGFTVDGSGDRFDLLDAGVLLSHVDGGRVEGLRVENAAFGILANESRGVLVRGNTIQGKAQLALGRRGDGIRFWETHDSTIEDNVVRDSRDVVVWYSPGARIAGNHVERGRYGTHLMYSHRAELTRNRYVSNEVGVFIMYSRDVTLMDNVMADATGAAGMGLGIKESGNVTARHNHLLHNTVSAYLDTTPLNSGDENLFEDNEFRLSDVGIVFHSSQRANRFRSNALRDNRVHVRVDGGGDALGVEWSGNDFDDYAGYDLDGDGFGDVPYELRSLSAQLTDHHPTLTFFQGSPTLALIEAAGRSMALFQPRPVLRDPRPRMGARPQGEEHAAFAAGLGEARHED